MAGDNDAVALAAKYWFGYGRWDAPYWFIGPEPGQAKDEGDNLALRCDGWLRLCPDGPPSGELIDAYEHHKAFGHLKFFDKTANEKRVPMQTTWRQLIRLLLAYKGDSFDSADAANDAIAEYQSTQWGRSGGETSVVELSSLASNSLATEQHLRLQHRSERIATLRQRIAEHSPRFVVMYGGGEALDEAWRAIACRDGEDCLEPTKIDGFTAKFARRDGTAYVVARHPASHGTTDAYWVGIGDALRSMTG